MQSMLFLIGNSTNSFFCATGCSGGVAMGRLLLQAIHCLQRALCHACLLRWAQAHISELLCGALQPQLDSICSLCSWQVLD